MKLKRRMSEKTRENEEAHTAAERARCNGVVLASMLCLDSTSTGANDAYSPGCLAVAFDS